MNFFRFYQHTPYTFLRADGTSYSLSLTNFTQRAILQEQTQPYLSALYDYDVRDGERPDTVATNIYGDPKYTWLVLIVNNILSLYDWPLTNEEFELYLTSKYGSLATATAVTTDNEYYFDYQQTPVTYAEYCALPIEEKGAVLPARYCYDSTGLRIDPDSYDALATDLQGDVLTPYAFELAENERKRRIKIVEPKFLPQIEKSLKTLFI